MTVYHISPTTGRPNICRKKIRDCPFGADAPHFETKQEARDFIEKETAKNSDILASKTKDTPAPEKSDPVDNEEVYTVDITGLNKARRRVEMANEMLKRAGSESRFELEETPDTYEISPGIFVDVSHIKLNRPTLSVNGFTFMAKVDIEEGGTLLKASPEIDTSGLPRPEENICEHCGVKRNRVRSYLIRDDKTGDVKQVGHSCLQAYTGISPTLWTLDINADDVTKKEDIDFDDFPKSSMSYSTKAVLKMAYLISNGGRDYISRSAADSSRGAGESTGDRVSALLNPYNMSRVEDKMDEISDEKIQKIIDYAETVDGSYGENLKAVMRSGSINSKNIGIASSAVRAYYNKEKTVAVKKTPQQLAQELSQLKTTFPEKQKFPARHVRVEHVTNYQGTSYSRGDSGVTALITMKDDEGNTFIWRSKAKGAFDMKSGQSFQMEATPKRHNIYDGTAQVEINRPKFFK